LAQELGQYNIHGISIAPGIVRTKFSEALWGNPSVSDEAADNTALKHVAEPERLPAQLSIWLRRHQATCLVKCWFCMAGGFAR